MDYIFDGEIHSLNDKYFYIIEKYRSFQGFNEKYTKRKFLDKYIWYLFSVNFSHSQIEDIINEKERFVFINEKPFDTESLRKCGIYCMKFKKERR